MRKLRRARRQVKESSDASGGSGSNRVSGTRPERKRYGWLIGITVVWWVLIILMILKVDPSVVGNFILPDSYILPGLFVLGGVFLVLSIILMSSKRALIWSLVIVTSLLLRVWGVRSILNFLFLLGVGICFEVYLRQK